MLVGYVELFYFIFFNLFYYVPDDPDAHGCGHAVHDRGCDSCSYLSFETVVNKAGPAIPATSQATVRSGRCHPTPKPGNVAEPLRHRCPNQTALPAPPVVRLLPGGRLPPASLEDARTRTNRAARARSSFKARANMPKTGARWPLVEPSSQSGIGSNLA